MSDPDHDFSLFALCGRCALEEMAVKVANRIGIESPYQEITAWLTLHRSEAEACMESTEFRLLSQQMGWNT